MTVVILDGRTGPLAPYHEWLDGRDLVLFTGRPVELGGYTDIRVFFDYATTAAVELAVLDLAARTPVEAIVATSFTDLVRAGALRDHLGLDGQGRDAAIARVDLEDQRVRLCAAGVPTVHSGPVERASDLHWYAHRWGYPLRLRRQRAEGWPVVALLDDERAVTEFSAATFEPDLWRKPGLVAEPVVAGERRRARGDLARAALAALPDDTDGVVETVDGLVDFVGIEADLPSAVRAQAGLEVVR
ncbi:ATP-grasp domain-containing protein [Lentzea nigeriaca]|uniref:hypothetical protein n=1 Tax=Lentzea nigeriaca TaxID=1128665 RepID=UPI00195A0322|nr:hypothetical protein [Lentzea nigeriaca]MBM7856381.1 hypothetical protein [Lentzea nigeriaca]